MSDFSDLDPKSDSWQGEQNILIPYRTLIDSGYLNKLSRNTSYVYDKLKEVILADVTLPRRTAKSFDTGRNWANDYIMIMVTIAYQAPVPLPHDIGPNTDVYLEGIHFTQMTSEYQTWMGLHYKCRSAGGFWLWNPSPYDDNRVTGTIMALRRVTGLEVTS